MDSALLVIGMQYDYADGGDVGEPGCLDIIPKVNEAAQRFDMTYYCLDLRWVALRRTFKDPWDLENYAMSEMGGAMLLPGLEFPEHCHFVHFGSRGPGISAFDGYVYDNMKKCNREEYGPDDSLESHLRANEIKVLGVCGVPMGVVRKTIYDGAEKKFGVWVLPLACHGSQKTKVMQEICCVSGDDNGLDIMLGYIPNKDDTECELLSTDPGT